MRRAVCFDLDDTLIDCGAGRRRALAEVGPDPARASDFARVVAEAVVPMPGARELLVGLRGRSRIIIVSNGGSRTQRRKLEVSGLAALIDELVISADLGVEKPARGIFVQALGDLASERTLFVGDDPERDIAGAAALGMPTAWLAHGRAYPSGLPCPTHTVHSLAEVLPLC